MIREIKKTLKKKAFGRKLKTRKPTERVFNENGYVSLCYIIQDKNCTVKEKGCRKKSPAPKNIRRPSRKNHANLAGKNKISH